MLGAHDTKKGGRVDCLNPDAQDKSIDRINRINRIKKAIVFNPVNPVNPVLIKLEFIPPLCGLRDLL